MNIRRPLSVFCLLFAFFLTVMLNVTGEAKRIGNKDTSLEGRHLSFEGTIRGIEEKNDRLVLQIGNISVSDSNILFYLNQYRDIRDKLHIGSKIQAEGDFGLFEEAKNKGQFDSRIYYGAKGYDHVVYNGKIISVSGSYAPLRDALYRIKENTKRVYAYFFDKDEYSVLDALVLADRGEMTRDVRERYKNAGISHILALSALHIAALGFMLLGMLRRMRIPAPVSAALAVTVMSLYCIMTGMPVSAQRALIMFALSLVSLLAGRTYDLKTASAAAAFIMLVINPDHLYDTGFILSFASVLGIGIVYPGLRELIMHLIGKDAVHNRQRSGKRSVRIVMRLLRTIVFSASLQLSILPVTMWYFYQLPTYGIAVNLIVVPLAGVLLFSSVAAGLTGNIVLYLKGAGINLYFLVRPFIYITKAILYLYDKITMFSCRLPGSTVITGRPKIWQIYVYYAALLTAVTGGYILGRRERKIKNSIKKSHLRYPAAAFLMMYMAGAVILFIKVLPAFELSALDVGQGQCFVVHGRNVPELIYDCGSTDEKDVGIFRLIPFLKYNGISRVDTVFVSHLDSDHVNGVIGLLNEENSGIKIGKVVISDGRAQKESENYPDLLEAAAKRRVPVYAMSGGEEIRWKNLSAKCLLPDPLYPDTGNDINENSLVVALDYADEDDINGRSVDFSALFTGDIGSETEDMLLERFSGENGRFDYLQVAHHGSRYSANKEFTDRVSPLVAIVSAGDRSRYGHPHKEMMDILNARPDTHTYITARDREIDCDLDDGRIRIFLFK